MSFRASTVALLLVAALIATGVSAGSVASPPTKVKGVFTAAVRVGNPGFSEGTLTNLHGFSADVARAIARRMHVKIRFVDYPFQELFVPGPKPYDAAFEFATILPGRKRWVDFSTPEYTSHQGVLVATDITGTVTLARLRTLQVCAKEATTGDMYVRHKLRPHGLILEYKDADDALKALSKSICDAFVFDLPLLIAAKRDTPARYGEIVGQTGPAEKIAVVLPKGSKLRPQVNATIRALRRSGKMHRLLLKHFGAALTSTPTIH